jgi:hypothetical protein
LVVELADGTRLEREGVRFRRNGEDGLADRLSVLRSPEALAGLALLSKDRPGRPAAQWVYFPAYRRVRRVASHRVGGAYVGSDFDYADLAPPRIEAGEHRVTSAVEVGGRACVVIETKKHPDLPFHKRVSMVDREHALAQRVEYYDEEDRLTKVATVERVAKIENWLTPVKISMTNKVTGSRSTIELEEIRYDVGLEPELFTVENLEMLGVGY